MTKSAVYSLTVFILTFLAITPQYSAVEKYCASRAAVDLEGCSNAEGFDLHALWLPFIQAEPAGFLGNDFVFEEDCNGMYVENEDGTAQLTGTVSSTFDPNKRFGVEMNFGGLTDMPPAGSPKLECEAGQDASNWRYYEEYSGILTGMNDYAGYKIMLKRIGPAFQVGDGANNKNFLFGAAGWFSWEVLEKPDDPEFVLQGSEEIPDDDWDTLGIDSLKRGDVNVNLDLICESFKGKVRDEFSTKSYDNNDGTVDWAMDWMENDPKGASQSPTEGQVRIGYNALSLDDYPNTGKSPSASRKADLSGAKFAILKFRFWTSSKVDPWDTIAVEASSDGGENFTVIQWIKGNYGRNWNYSALNITDFISENTVVRFRVAKRYGAEWDLFCVDNVQIEFGQDCDDACIPSSHNVKDKFNVVSYKNNDGSADWASKWLEKDPAWGGMGPGKGSVRVNGGTLELKDHPDSGKHPRAKRFVDLSCASEAILSFDFWTPYVEYDDIVLIKISSDGGKTFTVLEEIKGRQAPDWRHRSFDISRFASSQTVIEFKIGNKYGGCDDFVCFDNVNISYICKCAPSVKQ